MPWTPDIRPDGICRIPPGRFHAEDVERRSIRIACIYRLPAIVTPFDDNGALDLRALSSHLEWLHGEGMPGLIVAGTTGEWTSLSPAERRQLFDAVGAQMKGRLPIIAGCTSFAADGAVLLAELSCPRLSGPSTMIVWITIEGTYRQEGEGHTTATVAGVVAAGVFAAFITGKTAAIPAGRELKAHTKEAVTVAMAAAPSQPVAPAAMPAAAVAATPAS